MRRGPISAQPVIAASWLIPGSGHISKPALPMVMGGLLPAASSQGASAFGQSPDNQTWPAADRPLCPVGTAERTFTSEWSSDSSRPKLVLDYPAAQLDPDESCRYATSRPLANSSAQTQKPLMPSSIGAVGSTIPPQNASAFSLSDQRSATLVPMLREPPVVPRGVAILRVMVAKPRRGTTSSLLISFHASSCISAGNSGGSRSAPRNSDTLIRIRSFYDTRCCNRPAAIETED